jgi:hypothetical protein
MLSLSKKISLAASLLAITSAQFDAYSSNGNKDSLDQVRRQAAGHNAVQPINQLPKDIMRLILAKASNGINPRHIAAVCQHWNNAMRQQSEPHPVKMGVPYANLNDFMKTCMKIYWERRFNDGVLHYTDPDTKAAQALNFSALRGPL